MNTPKIIAVRSRFQDDTTGRWLVRFLPVFQPDVCASGSLSFAVWECWEDEPGTHAATELRAVANARDVLRRFADAMACKAWEVQGE